MDAETQLLAERQHGLLLTSQVTARGIELSTLRSWVTRGELIHLVRGLYVLATHEALTAEARHAQLARGGLLLMPDAVLSHWTALLAHRIPVLAIPRVVRLQRPIHRQLHRARFVVDPLHGEPISTEHGPAAPVVQALLGQARLRGLEAGLVSADAALRERAVSTDELRAQARGVRGPGAHLARRTAELADGTVESVGESRLRYTCLMGGLEVIPQATIRTPDGEFVARVDFRVAGTNVILEFDGQLKYADGDGATLWNEKQREDALRRLGYVIVRVTWADLDTPIQLLARIREAVGSNRAAAG